MRISDWSSDVCSSDLTEVPSKPFAQKSRIAVASASCVQNSRGRPLRALWSAPAIRPGQSAASCRNPVGDIDDLGLGEFLEAFDALLAADTGLLGDRKSTRLNSSH